jgi:tetratricopeptide (TPR) repeat protein
VIGMRALSLFATALFVLGSQGVAHAQADGKTPAPKAKADAERATELKGQADAAMLDLRYDEALSLYQQAYALNANPALLYNQGRAHQARGSFPLALAMLERFEREAPADLKARVPKLAELIAEVRAKVSHLTVKGNVAGAQLFVRNLPVGVLPLSAPLSLNAGPATIRLSAKGYRPLEKKVVLPGGDRLSLELALLPLRSTGRLSVRSPVAGATVFIDGKVVGTVPAEAELKPGKHKVTLHHDDYEDASTHVVLDAGSNKSISVELEELPAFYEKWWFWTSVGVVAAGAAVVVGFRMTEAPVEEGSIAPGQVSAPLLTF